MTETAHFQGSSLTASVQLGWRVAELYAQVDDMGAPSNDTLLPAHGSLDSADQLELHLRAAAGDARRAGVTSKGASLERLVEFARQAAESADAGAAFRAQLRRCHIEVEKDLWALDESAGKAYELGNALSDTYGRVCRAYRWPDEDPARAWDEVFRLDRIERMKKLLDDLQSRLEPTGVSVVREQLETWGREVPGRLAGHGVPGEATVRVGLRRQTIIWRQLLAGDKRPEAFLGGDARAEIRDELRDMVWRRYRRWVVPLTAVLFTIVLLLPQLRDIYHRGIVETGLASAAVAAAGAIGLTKASVVLTVRSRLEQWSQLLWARALAHKVGEVTELLDTVLPPVTDTQPRPRSLREPSGRAGAPVWESLGGRAPAHP